MVFKDVRKDVHLAYVNLMKSYCYLVSLMAHNQLNVVSYRQTYGNQVSVKLLFDIPHLKRALVVLQHGSSPVREFVFL